MRLRPFTIVIMCIISALCLCACGGKSDNQTAADPAVINSGFSCSFTAQYGDMALEGAMKMNDSGTEFIFSSPDTISGVIVTISPDNERLSLNYNGLEITLSEQKYPQTAFARLIVKAITAAENADYDKSTNTLSGSIDNSVSYSVTLDDEGYPSKITLPDYSLTVTLSDFA